MKTVVFQGDSITDCTRNREKDYYPGSGYATMVTGRLGSTYPGKFQFCNRGIGGNKVTDLLARWQKDCTNLKPDYLSIYVGVNDAWHEVDFGWGTNGQTFEKVYRILLDDTLREVPGVKIMLLTPYVVAETFDPEKLPRMQALVAEKVAIVKKLAAEYGLPCVELQPIFDAAQQKVGGKYWVRDGVHPNPAGSQLIADAWIAEATRQGWLEA